MKLSVRKQLSGAVEHSGYYHSSFNMMYLMKIHYGLSLQEEISSGNCLIGAIQYTVVLILNIILPGFLYLSTLSHPGLVTF